MNWMRWFVAGALAVPIHHQLVLLALNMAEMTDRAPWSMRPTEPFGIPSIISLSFWGGVWGLLLGLVLSDRRVTIGWWLKALLFGAIFPTVVAIFVVAPLKGIPIKDPVQMFIGGAMLNGAWGIGTASLALLFRKLFRQPL